MGSNVDTEIEQHVVEVGLATWQDVETTRRWLENAGQPLTTEAVLDEMAKGGVISEQQAKLVKDKVKGSRRGKTDAPGRVADTPTADDGTDGSGSGREVQVVCSICGVRAMVDAEGVLSNCPQAGCSGRLTYPDQTVRQQAGGQQTKNIKGLLGLYQLGRTLGTGGFSAVYEATIHDDKTGQSFSRAIKLLHEHLVPQGDEVLAFFEEVATLQQVTHPSMVRVYESGTTPKGQPYIVMDLVRGKNLQQITKERTTRLRVDVSLGIAAKVANALREAHRVGLIHRDIKPSNVMVRYEEDPTQAEAVLLDFGIAKLVDGTTGGGPTYSGTRAYQAPEQSDGHPEKASDVWAMGILLYEMLTGRLPHQDPSGHQKGKPHRHGRRGRTIQPLGPLDTEPALQAKIDRLVRQCLDERTDKRPTSGELAKQLGRLHATSVADVPRQGRQAKPLPWGRIALAASILLVAAGVTLHLTGVLGSLLSRGRNGTTTTQPVDEILKAIDEVDREVDKLTAGGSLQEARQRVAEFRAGNQLALKNAKYGGPVDAIDDKVTARLVDRVREMAGQEDLLEQFSQVVELVELLPPDARAETKAGIQTGLSRAVRKKRDAVKFGEATSVLSAAQSGDSGKLLEDAGLLDVVRQGSEQAEEAEKQFLTDANRYLSSPQSDWARARDALVNYHRVCDGAGLSKAKDIRAFFAKEYPEWHDLVATGADKEFVAERAMVASALREADSVASLRQAVARWASFADRFQQNPEAKDVVASALTERMADHFAEIDSAVGGLCPSADGRDSKGLRTRLDQLKAELGVFEGVASEALASHLSASRTTLNAKEQQLMERFASLADKAQEFSGKWEIWREFFAWHSTSPSLDSAKGRARSSFDSLMEGHLKRIASGVAKVSKGDGSGADDVVDSLRKARDQLGCIVGQQRTLGAGFGESISRLSARLVEGGEEEKSLLSGVLSFGGDALEGKDQTRLSSARNLLEKYLTGAWPSAYLKQARDLLARIKPLIPPIADLAFKEARDGNWAAALWKTDELPPGEGQRVKEDIKKMFQAEVAKLRNACKFDEAKGIANDVSQADHELARHESDRVSRERDEFVALARDRLSNAEFQWPGAREAVIAFYKERLDRGAFSAAKDIAATFGEKCPDWDVFEPSVEAVQRPFDGRRSSIEAAVHDSVTRTLSALSGGGTWHEADAEWKKASAECDAIRKYTESAAAGSLVVACVKGGEMVELCGAAEAGVSNALKLSPADLARALEQEVRPKIEGARARLSDLRKAMAGVTGLDSTRRLNDVERHIAERDPSSFAKAVLQTGEAAKKEKFDQLRQTWEAYLSGGEIWETYRKTAIEFRDAAETMAEINRLVEADQFSEAFSVVRKLSHPVGPQQEARVVATLKSRIGVLESRCEFAEAEDILRPIQGRVDEAAKLWSGVTEARDAFVSMAGKYVPGAKWPEAKTGLVRHYETEVRQGAFASAGNVRTAFGERFPGWAGLSKDSLENEQARFDEARMALVASLGNAMKSMKAAPTASTSPEWQKVLGEWQVLGKDVEARLGACSKNDEMKSLARACSSGVQVAQLCNALHDTVEGALKQDEVKLRDQLAGAVKGKVSEARDALAGLEEALRQVRGLNPGDSITGLASYVNARDPKGFLTALARIDEVRGDDREEMGVWDGYLDEHRSSRYGQKATNLRELVAKGRQVREMMAKIAKLTAEEQFLEAFNEVKRLDSLVPEVGRQEDDKVRKKFLEHLEGLLGKREFGRASRIVKDLEHVRGEVASEAGRKLAVAEKTDDIRQLCKLYQFGRAIDAAGELGELDKSCADQQVGQIREELGSRMEAHLKQRRFDEATQAADELKKAKSGLAKTLAQGYLDRAKDEKDEFCRRATLILGQAEWPQCRREVLAHADRSAKRGNFGKVEQILESFPDWDLLGPTKELYQQRKKEVSAALKEADDAIQRLAAADTFDEEAWGRIEQRCHKLLGDFEDSQQARQLVDDCAFARYEAKTGTSTDGPAERWAAWSAFLERYPKSPRAPEAEQRKQRAFGNGKTQLSDIVKSTLGEGAKQLEAKEYQQAQDALKQGKTSAQTLNASFNETLGFDPNVFDELRRRIASEMEFHQIISSPRAPEWKSRLAAFLDKHPGHVEGVKKLVRAEAGNVLEPHCSAFEAVIERKDAVTKQAFDEADRHLDRAREALQTYVSDFESIPALKTALDGVAATRIDPLKARLSPKLTLRSEPSEADVFVLLDGGKKIRIGQTPLVGFEYVAKRCTYRISVQKGGWGSPAPVELPIEGDTEHDFTLEEYPLPPGFNRLWTIPDRDVDQYGNPVVERDGSRFDPKTKWPYEIWLAQVKLTGRIWDRKRLVVRKDWMEFVLVPSGRYKVSDLGSELRKRYVPMEGPGGTPSIIVRKEPLKLRPVPLTPAIYIGKYEVTRDQFAVHDTWKGKNLDSRGPQHAAYPVLWPEAAHFCKKLGGVTQTLIRLPSDLEWGCACRAGTETDYPWGNDLSPGLGNFILGDGKGEMAPVGRFPANGFGLYDAIGGVSEWCDDDRRFNCSGTHGITRGGCFMKITPSITFMIASHYRVARMKATRRGLVGCRVCVSVR